MKSVLELAVEHGILGVRMGDDYCESVGLPIGTHGTIGACAEDIESFAAAIREQERKQVLLKAAHVCEHHDASTYEILSVACSVLL